MKKICFRFDVDTYRCASEGVPNLVALAQKHQVSFTFFYNMGRAIHFPSLLKGRQEKVASAEKLSSFKKLGKMEYLRTILLNPLVGASQKDALVSAYRLGHEIGLHGGRNHGSWMRSVGLWEEEKLHEEVSWGLSQLAGFGVNNVVSFSSPGWKTAPSLNAVLVANGFRVVADRHGRLMEEITSFQSEKGEELKEVPTNLLGEPGGVGYVENLRARGMCDVEILSKFKADLESIGSLAVIYDHPFYAGVHELSVIDAMIAEAKSQGFRFSTIKDLVI